MLLPILLLWGSSAFASGAAWQEKDWDEVYQRAVDLIETAVTQDAGPEAGAWAESISLLQQAIAIKPEPQTGRFGMLLARRKKYFPYFYLGLASLRSGLLEQSLASFQKAREFGAVLEDEKLGPELQQHESLVYYRIGTGLLERDELAEALENFEKARQLGGLPTELKARLDSQIASTSQRIEATTRRFDSLVQSAQSNLEAGRYGSALQEFAEAERLDPTEYQRRQLKAGRARAENGHVDQLMADVSKSGSSAESYTKLRQALSVLPNRTDVQEALRALVGDYRALKAQADGAYQESEWASALRPYRQALLFFPREAVRDRLGSRIETATRNLIRESVSALVSGQIEKAVGDLEKALEDGGSDVRVNAYLGVAYSKLAFRSADPGQLSELHAKALEQFRRARRLDPKFHLPPRIVSPLILELFDRAGN